MVDLEKLKALALAATPGPWQWWTSNSTLRLTGADGKDGGVLHAYAHRGYGDISCSEVNRVFIEAANPAAVLELIAENARLKADRATPPSSSTAPTEQNQPDQLNVTRPFAAPASQHDAIVSTMPIETIVRLMDENTDRDFGLKCEPFARAVEVETIRRCRTQGGVTNSKPSSTAPTVEVDEDLRIARHAVFNLKEFREGRSTFPGEALGILERCLDRLASRPPAEATGERERELCATIGAMQAQIDRLNADLAAARAGGAVQPGE